MSKVAQNVYPLDMSMTLESNYIEQEKKMFTIAEDRMFVPNGGPFFTESVKIRNVNGNLLKPQIDYKLLYLNEEASKHSGRDVVAVIWILDESVSGVTLDYRVVGGQYGNTVNAILHELRNSGPILKNVDWNTNVFNKPEIYPPAPHFHTPDTFTGWETVYRQLEGIRKAIIGGDLPAWQAHYNYVRNLIKDLTENGNLNLDNYVQFDDLKDHYTKDDIDGLLEIVKTQCCNGNGNGNGNGGGPISNGEDYVMRSDRVLNNVVFTITSSNPDSEATAPYRVVESIPTTEKFTCTSTRVGDNVKFTIRSSDRTSITQAPYRVIESVSTGETFTTSTTRIDDKIYFTITSSNPDSEAIAKYTITDQLK